MRFAYGRGDLCGRSYPSGVTAHDNVASLLLVEMSDVEGLGESLSVDVYGTCRDSERPADPMLTETVALSQMLRGSCCFALLCASMLSAARCALTCLSACCRASMSFFVSGAFSGSVRRPLRFRSRR